MWLYKSIITERGEEQKKKNDICVSINFWKSTKNERKKIMLLQHYCHELMALQEDSAVSCRCEWAFEILWRSDGPWQVPRTSRNQRATVNSRRSLPDTTEWQRSFQRSLPLISFSCCKRPSLALRVLAVLRVLGGRRCAGKSVSDQHPSNWGESIW